MARLIVEAIAEDVQAAPGNKLSCVIIVSVTDANGEPTTGLTKTNFKVVAQIVPPAGSAVNVKSVFEPVGEGTPGYYSIELVPLNPWLKGVYILSVATIKGANKGQTLTSVLLD